MSLGWLFCSTCLKYRKWPESYTYFRVDYNPEYPLDCGHSSGDDNVPKIFHRFETDDQYEEWAENENRILLLKKSRK